MSIPIACDCGQTFAVPDEDAGRLARCPVCKRECLASKPAPASDVLFIGWEPTATSGKAIASLVLGALFFFACLSGLPAIILGRQALQDIDRSGGRLKGRKMANAGIVLGLIGCLYTVAWSMSVRQSTREAARRAWCTNNLKQIGLAMSNYVDSEGFLPPSAITDKAGRPLLSWRVAILPFLDSSDLSMKFHLDEPWDSPHNLTLLDKMPYVYSCPSDKDRKPGMTGYQVVNGPRTAFPPDLGPLKLGDITDGPANTILVGESLRLVPWTKPEDLSVDPTAPLSGLGSHHGYRNNGFNALFGDGSVKFLKGSIDPTPYLTRNGNESIPHND